MKLLIFTVFCLGVSLAQDQVITAEPGQTVTLPCRAPQDKNLAGVEWSRPDLDPKYVLLLRDGHMVSDEQQPSFKDRASLQSQRMEGRDVSLVLKDVSTADDGTYECQVLTAGSKREKRAIEPISSIYLRVSPPAGGSVGAAVGLSVAVVVLLAVAAAVVGLVIYRKRSSRQTPASSLPPAVEMQLLHHV